MADAAVTTEAETGKVSSDESYVATLEDTIFQAMKPLGTAIDLISDRHLGEPGFEGAILLLERIFQAAHERLRKFDDDVREHLGYVGLRAANFQHPTLAGGTVVGPYLCLKEGVLRMAKEVSHE